MSKYTKIYERACKENPHASWYSTAICALAEDLAEYTGKKTKIHGPFGLRAAVYIDVGEDFILLTPEFHNGGLTLYYDTGEQTQQWQPNSLGDYNGMNNVRASLPDALEEIVKVLRPLR